jgi:hypothetical protein
VSRHPGGAGIGIEPGDESRIDMRIAGQFGKGNPNQPQR